MGSHASVRRCVQTVMGRAGQIDVLVNNAGVEHLGMAEEKSIDAAREVFETNFFGVVRMNNAVQPQMRPRRAGRIITVGSLGSWVGEPGEAFYSASKSALAVYTESLRHEVWPLGIHVSLVEPGAFTTDIVESASTSGGTITDYDAVRTATQRTMRNAIRTGATPAKWRTSSSRSRARVRRIVVTA